jgi:hypothetical protein
MFGNELMIHLELTLNKPQFSMSKMVFNVRRVVMELAQDCKSFLFLAFRYQPTRAFGDYMYISTGQVERRQRSLLTEE